MSLREPHDSSVAVQVDEHGRIIGLNEALVNQIADRVTPTLGYAADLSRLVKYCKRWGWTCIFFLTTVF